jgi:hypothetical protein
MRIFFIPFLLIISLVSEAQQDFTQHVANKYFDFSTNNKVEKIYLHLDKLRFDVEEKVYFKAFLVEGYSHKIDSTSKVFYVELQNPLLKNKVILTKKIGLENGIGLGNISFPDTLSSGAYRLVAYTQWMKNGKPDFYFQATIHVKNSQKPRIEDTAIPKYNISFYPEGGKWIDGVLTKVAVKGTFGYGHSGYQGYIVGSKGDTIMSFNESFGGVGTFRMKPKFGEKYSAIVRFSDQVTTTFPLPEVQQYGFGLSLDNTSDEQVIGINIKGNLPAERIKQKMFVVAQCRGNVVFTGRFDATNSKTVLPIPRAMLPDGLVQFQIFDENGMQFAERLIYSYMPKSLIFDVKDSLLNDKEKLITVAVQDQNGRNVDAALAINTSLELIDFQEDMKKYFFLSSDLSQEADLYDTHNRGNKTSVVFLDNFLITQQWKRFTWSEVNNYKKVLPKFLPDANRIAIDKMATPFFFNQLITKNGTVSFKVSADTKKIFIQAKTNDGAMGSLAYKVHIE